jgi:hypothetical protein
MNERSPRARSFRTWGCSERTWLVPFVCALLGSAHAVHAQPTAAPAVLAATELRPAVSARPGAPVPKVDPKQEARSEREAALSTARDKLSSPDADAVQQALTELAALGGKDAAALVIARARRGLPPQLIDVSIDTLVTLKDPSAIPLLLELATHRRYQVRSHAVDALGALGAKNAEAVLLYALDDPSSDVREAAVRSLGKVGSRRAIKPLLAANERGLVSALGAVGALGSTQEAELLITRAKAGQVDAARPGFIAMLTRINVPVATKTKIIATLRDLGTPAARDCLAESLRALGDKGDARIKTQLAQALGTAPAPAPVATKSAEVAR